MPAQMLHLLRVLYFLLIVLVFANTSFAQQADRLFSAWDKNGDGVLIPQEVPKGPREIFAAVDRNSDGKVTLAEHKQGPDRDKLRAMERANPKSSSRSNTERAEKRNAPTVRDAIVTEFSIRQTWHQEPDGFDRPIYVRTPTTKLPGKSLPVVIFLHGNGGQASRALNHWRELNPCIFIAPQGYERSWNIFGEKSEAPDVKFVEEIVAEIPRRFPSADMQNVSVIGSSNGGGFIYRLLVEMDEIPFRLAVPTISSLIVQQYHDGEFWRPSKSTKNYDRKQRWSVDRKWPTVLYFHGTEDRVVPYKGGMRMGVKHLSARETVYALARARGYRGNPVSESDGVAIEPGLIAFDYPKQRVTLFQMTGVGHNLGEYRGVAARLILDEMK